MFRTCAVVWGFTWTLEHPLLHGFHYASWLTVRDNRLLLMIYAFVIVYRIRKHMQERKNSKCIIVYVLNPSFLSTSGSERWTRRHYWCKLARYYTLSISLNSSSYSNTLHTPSDFFPWCINVWLPFNHSDTKHNNQCTALLNICNQLQDLAEMGKATLFGKILKNTISQ